MKKGKEFYALAIEENGSYGLLDRTHTACDNMFKTIKAARLARDVEDCPEALDIVRVRVVEGD